GAAVFDRDNPRKATWRSDYPLWEAPSDWPTRIVHPLGIIEFERTLMAYWEVDGAIYASALPRFWRDRNWPGQIPATAPALQRYEGNPVLEPRATHPWDAVAAFNPTALHEDGKTHILYRAIGVGDVSVIGHAVSKDGSDIHYRSDHPVYAPREPFEGAGHKHKGINPKQYPNMAYISGGGGAGGCEDPRLTRIDDTVYMTYVAYDGGSPPRVALTSIGIDDFLEGEWNWTKPVLISEPGVINKNACILPEKINGKYVIFHRVYPDILIDYVDDLEFDGETKWLETKAKISPRATAWDSRKIGVGPTPLKTDKGWLVIYQAVGEQDPSRYKMGAMLLDLKDPSKVLYRSRHPILEPVEWYENNGHKYGVIYPCGAVIRDDMLYVYYGGADKVVCVASAPLKEFLEQLISTESPHLRAVSVG
ncbi:MAG TPA: hypothetical protein VMC43_02780, partial [Candidatus Paceibacterota bacterium]|nr:hypothetical protein [Candidatus Paceibacterota bacterium]